MGLVDCTGVDQWGGGSGAAHMQKSKVRSDLPIFCLYTASNFSFIDTVNTSFHRPARPAGRRHRERTEVYILVRRGAFMGHSNVFFKC